MNCGKRLSHITEDMFDCKPKFKEVILAVKTRMIMPFASNLCIITLVISFNGIFFEGIIAVFLQ